MKQVNLINQLDLPHFAKEMGIGVLFISQKCGRVQFSPKKGEVGKMVEEEMLLREHN